MYCFLWPSVFQEALLLKGFLRDIDSRNQAINPSDLEKSDLSTPLFMVYLLLCYTDDMTNRRTNKQTNRRQLKVRGTYRVLRILSGVKHLW